MTQTATKHTPGPWMQQTIRPHDDSGWHVRNRDIGRGVCDISPASWENTDKEELAANARLIAAAPELLEACKRAINTLNGCEESAYLGIAGNHADNRDNYYRYQCDAIDALEVELARVIGKADVI